MASVNRRVCLVVVANALNGLLLSSADNECITSLLSVIKIGINPQWANSKVVSCQIILCVCARMRPRVCAYSRVCVHV